MNTIYGSVLRDQGQWRMWYKAGMGVAYAQSDDGIKWAKPLFDLNPKDGRKTNILLRKKAQRESPTAFPYFYELFGVHRDDADPDPQRRYKMGFLSIDWNHKGEGGDPFHPGQRRGLGVAGQPGRAHWKLINNFATEAICDGATHWMFDPARKAYVLYGRTRKQPRRDQGSLVEARLVPHVVLRPRRRPHRIEETSSTGTSTAPPPPPSSSRPTSATRPAPRSTR